MLYNFTPNKPHAKLLSPTIYFPLWRETRNVEENKVRVWLTDQIGAPLDFEDDWSVTLQLTDKKNNKL